MRSWVSSSSRMRRSRRIPDRRRMVGARKDMKRFKLRVSVPTRRMELLSRNGQNLKSMKSVRSSIRYKCFIIHSFKMIEDQKSVFARIVEGKDHLIKVFLDELNKKDDDYGKMIKD